MRPECQKTSESNEVTQRKFFVELKRWQGGSNHLVIAEWHQREGESFQQKILIPEAEIPGFLEQLRKALDLSEAEGGKAYAVEQVRQRYPKAYEKWSADEDARLREAVAKNKDVQSLAQVFARQPGAIRSRLTKLGLLQP